MSNYPSPDDIEYLTQEPYNTIPKDRLIHITPHYFDLELLARWIKINPRNPLTREIFNSVQIWKIIIKYNNYLKSANPILNGEVIQFNYTDNQFIQICNQINISINNNSNYIPENIVLQIENIRRGININVLVPREQIIHNPIIDSNTNSITNFQVGQTYIFININNGMIGRTQQFVEIVDGIPRFGFVDVYTEMPFSEYLFYNQINGVANVEVPRPLQLNELVVGSRYIILQKGSQFLAKSQPFVCLYASFNGFNGYPQFSFNIDYSSAIFNPNLHYFYERIQLNQIGIICANDD